MDDARKKKKCECLGFHCENKFKNDSPLDVTSSHCISPHCSSPVTFHHNVTSHIKLKSFSVILSSQTSSLPDLISSLIVLLFPYISFISVTFNLQSKRAFLFLIPPCPFIRPHADPYFRVSHEIHFFSSISANTRSSHLFVSAIRLVS